MPILNPLSQAASISPHYQHAQCSPYRQERYRPQVHSAALASLMNCSSHFISGLEGIEEQKTVSAGSSCPDARGSAGRCRSSRHVAHRCNGPTSLRLSNHGGQPFREKSPLSPENAPGCLQTGVSECVTPCFRTRVSCTQLSIYYTHIHIYISTHTYMHTYTCICINSRIYKYHTNAYLPFLFTLDDTFLGMFVEEEGTFSVA